MQVAPISAHINVLSIYI